MEKRSIRRRRGLGVRPPLAAIAARVRQHFTGAAPANFAIKKRGMNVNLILFPAFLAFNAFATAQCPDFQLSDLQALQRAEPEKKENEIQLHGFDLRSAFELQGEAIRQYSKCWYSSAGDQPVFEQLIWWNQTSNSIVFLTVNEAQFKGLRQRIVERQSSGRITENPDFYLGKMFRYRFGTRQVEHATYYFVEIGFP